MPGDVYTTKISSVRMQGSKRDSKLGKVAATEQEQTPETPAKQQGCWYKLRKVTMGK